MDRKKLPEYLFSMMPVLHRKLLHHRPPTGMPRQLMNVLHKIAFNDGMPMKFYGEKMFISKPNLTKVVNELIKMGYVIRHHSQTDRRVITLHITEEGRVMVKTYFDDLSAHILDRANVLSDEEVEALMDCVETIKKIVEKLDDTEKGGCCQ